MIEKERQVTRKRAIVTTKREVWLICYEDDDVDNVVHEAFDDLGDYDELFVEETDDVVTDEDIEYAENHMRLVEFIDE